MSNWSPSRRPRIEYSPRSLALRCNGSVYVATRLYPPVNTRNCCLLQFFIIFIEACPLAMSYVFGKRLTTGRTNTSFPMQSIVYQNFKKVFLQQSNYRIPRVFLNRNAGNLYKLLLSLQVYLRIYGA